YALFYITTAFSLSYGVSTLGYSRETFLGLLCFAVWFMGLATPLAALATLSNLPAASTALHVSQGLLGAIAGVVLLLSAALCIG
ncbi:hypothetical protein M1697_23100, partial [Salmonella enterica subsp. enterica serovar Oranienburg]|nr:hypothetical protein [Salmonella enterica subsp. enterica serovar Oranienburg]